MLEKRKFSPFSQYFQHIRSIFQNDVHVRKLTINERVNRGEGSEEYAKYLLNIGDNKIHKFSKDKIDDFIKLPAQLMSTTTNLENFVTQM